MELARLLMPSGSPSTQNTRNCFPQPLVQTAMSPCSKRRPSCRAFSLTLRPLSKMLSLRIRSCSSGNDRARLQVEGRARSGPSRSKQRCSDDVSRGNESCPAFSHPSEIAVQNNKEESNMSETSTLIGYSGRTIGREELTLVPTPPATETHRPIPHHEIVRALVETLGFRHIGVVHDEYAVSPDGMKAFGVLDLESEMEGCRFSIGLRNSHDKSMRLAMTCGYRVFVCSNMAFAGDFTPVLAKHSKSFSLIDCISVGVDRMQRNFAPMQKQVESWQSMELSNVSAKMIVYEAFIESELEVPKHLARTVHDLYFEPKYEEFRPRTMWSLSNAFTSAFKALDPIPQCKATAKLGAFLEERLARKF